MKDPRIPELNYTLLLSKIHSATVNLRDYFKKKETPYLLEESIFNQPFYKYTNKDNLISGFTNAYHNPAHIWYAIRSFESYLDRHFNRAFMDESVQNLITTALFFHDIIYCPESTDNELCSIDLFLKEAHYLTPDERNFVVSLIYSTNPKLKVPLKLRLWQKLSLLNSVPTLNTFRLFKSLDYSIFSANEEDYNDYYIGLMHEYSFMDLDIYCDNRLKFLKEAKKYLTSGRYHFSVKTALENTRREELALLKILLAEKPTTV